jgi:hypothetical protein
LEGSTFTVLTDHNPLIHLPNQPMMSRRQVRWSEFLQQFIMKWEYKPGAENPADPLSRPRLCVMSTTPMSKHMKRFHKQLVKGVTEIGSNTVDPIKISDLHKAYSQDTWFSNPLNVQDLINDSNLWWKNGKLVIPDDPILKDKILRHCHDAIYAGHLGRTKTYDLVTRHYWWPGVRKYVAHHCRTCDSCQRVRINNQKEAGLYQPISVDKKQWNTVTMDLIVELPKTENGNTNIVVFCDKLTKMIHVVPTAKVDASDMADIFLHHVFRYHGLPERFIHDRDTRFTSKFWKAFFSLCRVTNSNSTAYHPQTDGQTEVVNKSIEDFLRHFVDENQTDWDKLLIFAEFAFNNSKHESTGFTPFELNYGYHPNLPTLWGVFKHSQPEVEEPQSSKCPGADNFFKRIQEAITVAKRSLESAQQRQRHMLMRKGGKWCIIWKIKFS